VALVRKRQGQRNENLNSVAHGPHWRALRCNLTAGTLHPSRLGCLAPLQREAIQDLIATLSSKSKGAVTELHAHLYGAVFSVVARLCFGDGVDDRDVRAMCRVIKDLQLSIGVVRPFSPSGSVLDKLVEWRRLRRLFAINARLTEMFLPFIKARPSPCDNGGRRPYVDSLVDLRIPSNEDEHTATAKSDDVDCGRRALRDDEIVNLIKEFLGAGTGTVAVCLEWALAHLVDRPEVQRRLRREVDAEAAAVSRAGAGMPYLHAVVLETLRMHPPLPVLPRHVQSDAAAGVLGLSASDLYVNFAVADIGRDGRTWTNPDEFQPERFLAGGEADGVGPLPGPKGIRMMPFGAGHRFCPGVGMAMVNIKCFLAALVREFDWAPPSAGGGVDLTELDGFFKVMKTPLSARATPRNQGD